MRVLDRLVFLRAVVIYYHGKFQHLKQTYLKLFECKGVVEIC